MISEVKIQNMKLFDSFSIKGLKKFNLFVGKNNCGKTTLLENLFILIAPSNTGLLPKIHSFRGHTTIDESYFSQYFHNLNMDNKIKIVGKVKIGKLIETRTIKISPEFEKQKTTFSESATEIVGLKYEYILKSRGKKIMELPLSLNREGAIVKGTLPKGYKEPLFGAFYSPTTMYWDIAARLNKVKIEKKTKDLIKILKKIDNKIIDIELLGNKIYCDIGLSNLIPLNLMGDGLIRVLGILLSVYSCRNGILLLDEVESGLHYSTLKILWRAIIESAYLYNVQVFATTHSFECLEAYSVVASEKLDLENDYRLYRLEKENSTTNAIEFSQNELSTAINKNWEVR